MGSYSSKPKPGSSFYYYYFFLRSSVRSHVLGYITTFLAQKGFLWGSFVDKCVWESTAQLPKAAGEQWRCGSLMFFCLVFSLSALWYRNVILATCLAVILE